MTKDRPIKHYLSSYAHKDSRLDSFPDKLYSHAIILPAYAEDPDELSRLLLNLDHYSALIIVVVNCPPENPDNRLQVQKTRSCLSALQQQFPRICLVAQNMSLHSLHNNASSNLLLINRCSPSLEIPSKHGVGLARRIAADIACQLIEKGCVQSPWVHSIDADVILPNDYLSSCQQSEAAACVYPFLHDGANNRITIATLLYELHLRNYVAGLKWAGSPFAFHSIGSCLAFHATAYAKVRGFPLRSAGEDFYLLNKLAKVGNIESLDCPPVTIQARQSNRAPFGTGPAVESILVARHSLETYQTYHPQLFEILRQWLSMSNQLWEQGANFLEKLPEEPLFALNQLGFVTFLTKLIDQAQTEIHFMKGFHDWFDGFRTLRFIHILREKYYSDISIADCMSAPHLQTNTPTPCREAEAFSRCLSRLFQKMDTPLD